MTKPKTPWRCEKCGGRGIIIPRASPRSKVCAWCADELAHYARAWCSTGKHAVPIGEMHRPTECKACNKARCAAWRAANPGKVKARNTAYHAEHRDEHNAACHAYYQANRTALLAQKKDYYKANAESIKAKAARQRLRISDASKAKARRRHQEKRLIYKANEKINRARRLINLLRGGTR